MRVFLILATLSGCSIALQSRPTKGRSDCTAIPALAVVDTVVAVAAIGTAVAGMFVGGDAGNTMTGTGLVGGIVFVASAEAGYKWAGQCREMHAQPVARR